MNTWTIERCAKETNHAQKSNSHFCHCTHVMYDSEKGGAVPMHAAQSITEGERERRQQTETARCAPSIFLTIAKLRYVLYEAIVELQYVQDAEHHSQCASAKGREIIQRGMELLEVPDLSLEHL